MCCLLLQIALFAVQSTEIPAVNISSVFQHCLESFLEWGGAGHMKMHSYIYFSRYFSLFIVAVFQCEILENRTRGLLETVETGNLRVDNIFILLFFLCFFFFFSGQHLRHMEVPRLGVQSKLKLLVYTPEPQQHQIRATSVTYTSAHGNAGSLTH